MGKESPQRKKIDQQVQEKQEMAGKLADRLRRRAGLLRKFAEKYRNNSAEQLYGWKDIREDQE